MADLDFTVSSIVHLAHAYEREQSAQANSAPSE